MQGHKAIPETTRILYCVDAETLSDRKQMAAVADVATTWAHRLNGTIDLIHVRSPVHASMTMTGVGALGAMNVDVDEKAEHERTRQRLDEIHLMMPSEVRGKSIVAVGDVAQAVADHAELEPDVVLVRSQRRTGIDRLLFGSMSERIARTADIPVIVTGKSDGTEQRSFA